MDCAERRPNQLLGSILVDLMETQGTIVDSVDQNQGLRGKVGKKLHILLITVVGVIVFVALAVQQWVGVQVESAKTQKPEERVVDREPSLVDLQLDMERQRDKAEKELAAQQAETPQEPAGFRDVNPVPQLPPPSMGDAKAMEAALASPILAFEADKTIVRGTGLPDLARELTAGLRAGEASGLPNSGSMADANALLEVVEQQIVQSRTAGNERWLEKAGKTTKTGNVKIQPPAQGVLLHEGSVIPAVLLTKANSDLPGILTARVTQDVYDSVHGRTLVIPKGTRVVGRYNADISHGQRRMLAAFHRLIFPNGATADLGAMQGADAIGQSGLSDQVDTHFWEMLGSSLLVATLASLTEDSSGNGVTIVGASGDVSARSAAGEVLVDTASVVLAPYREMKPTLIVRPGQQFNIMVNRDIAL